MSKKILSPIGSLLLGKKKKAAPVAAPVAAAPAKKGPIITQLGKTATAPPSPLRRRIGGIGTILSDKLGA